MSKLIKSASLLLLNCSSVFVWLLTFTSIVFGGGHETPQQVVTRYNNYKTICNGLGYQNVRCDAGKQGKTVTY